MRPRILLGIGLLLGGALAHAADPAQDVKKATWHESLLASRQALARASAGKALRVPLPDLGKTPFTIMAWVRTRRGGTILAKAPARGKWAAQGKTFFIRGGRLCFDIGWAGAVTGRRNVADGQWHHVAATRGRDLRFYVDGTLDQTGHLQFEADPRAFVAKIGYTSDNFPAPSGYQGALDEVRLYARELSAHEIAAHARERQPAKAEALVGYWPFDGGGADASGSGNHAAGVARAKTVAGKHGQAVELDGRTTLRLPSVGSSAADDLWALVERDFPDPAVRKEMAWEREDRIWPAKPDADSPAAFARRYAVATQRPNALARDATALAAKATTPADLARVRALYLASRRYGEALGHIAAFDLQGLRATIGDL
ncbi:LamG domain-containing protein, partial [bacterium]|nr:LamG domain-containing protein [bacterium]